MMGFIGYIKYKIAYRNTKKSGAFDVEYYLINNPDVREADIDPIKHYLLYGASEGRDPSPNFSTRSYLVHNSDVKETGVNPFFHYLKYGVKEGRDFVSKRLLQPENNKLNIPKIKFDSGNESYQSYIEHKKIKPLVKAIAFYLPQFHPFPENDEWWGKGFTEWSNVGKALPNYIGHYQPHCPIHNGYYDLRIPQVMEEQARLAKLNGVYGFSYYFYWFGGKILMEEPLKKMLNNKQVDIPFCFTWANENWTRRWDGQDNDVLIAQKHSKEDSISLLKYLVPYFKDERYIKIDGKPVLIIYRPGIIPKIKETAELWRTEIREYGFEDIYLISAQTFGNKSPEPYDFDAAVQFPPHTVKSGIINDKLKIANPNFNGKIFSYEQVVMNAVVDLEPEYKLYRSATLSWDNTARKQNDSHIFHGFSLLKYKQWLDSISTRVFNDPKYSSDEKLIFINAWNEWAEGTHLEPDRKYGYAYLNTTYDVLSKYDHDKMQFIEGQKIKKKSDIAVIVHMHYTETWKEIKQSLSNFEDINFDLYVSTTNSDFIRVVKKDFPDSFVKVVENRGRDILPLIQILKDIRFLNYECVCKIHSKKSIYRSDGDQIRKKLISELIPEKKKLSIILNRFKNNEKLGMLVPSGCLIQHTEKNLKYNLNYLKEIEKITKIKFRKSMFPAGSMFWFKKSALQDLLKLNQDVFDIEDGLVDGTMAHAIERFFPLFIKNASYFVDEL